MIAAKVLPTWLLSQTADGVILQPPEGAHLGVIRIRENQRPLVSAADLFTHKAQQLTVDKLELGRIERMITCEGEFAAVQVQHGVGPDGVGFIRCLGAVFGDDHYTLVDAGTTVADRFAFFEQAARTFTFFMALGLGYRRRRRFEYKSPALWSGVARGLDTVWMPPGYPKVRAQMTVHAALPAGSTPADIRDAIIKRLELSGLTGVKVGDPERRFTGGELSGVAWRSTGSDEGATTYADVVVLEDERFVYPFELVSNGEHIGEARTAFDVVVHSARGVPLPEAQPMADSTLHWAT